MPVCSMVEARLPRPIEGLFTRGVLDWWHEALDDMDWAFDCLCPGDHHPGIRVGGGWSLHPLRVGLRTLPGRHAPAGGLSGLARNDAPPLALPRVRACLDPQFLIHNSWPITLPRRPRTC